MLCSACREPGLTDTERADKKDAAGARCLIARTTLLWVEDLMVGKRVTRDARDASNLWRGGFAQRWCHSDPHKEYMYAAGVASKNSMQELDAHREKLAAENEKSAEEILRAFHDAATLDDAIDELTEARAAKAEAAFVANQRQCKALWSDISKAMPKVAVAAAPSAPEPEPEPESCSPPLPHTLQRRSAFFDVSESKVAESLAQLTHVPEFSLPGTDLSLATGEGSGASVPCRSAVRFLNDVIMRRPAGLCPNSGQACVLQLFAEYIDNKQSGCNPLPPRVFLHGAGGVGKSFILHCVDELFAVVGQHVVPCALTGVACSAISCRDPARTLHKTCLLDTETLRPLDKLRPEEEHFMIAHFANCGALTVDEISFAGACVLDGISQRLQLLRPNSGDDFGGFPLIISGDMFQLPAVGDEKLYEQFFKHSTDYDTTNPADQMTLNGIRLLKTFKFSDLKQQMRCLDELHLSQLDGLRAGQTNGFFDYVLAHQLKPCDAKNDPTWSTATIIVKENAKRCYLNCRMAERFAAATGNTLISWRLEWSVPPKKSRSKHGSTYRPNDGSGRSKAKAVKLPAIRAHFSDAFVESVYEHTEDLTYRFVPGAPATILTNLNPSRGVANGIACELHSLTFSDSTRKEAEKLIAAAHAANKPHLQLPFAPSHVNVRLPGPPHPSTGPTPESKAAHAAFVASFADVTLVEGDVVIPIDAHVSARRTTPAYSHRGVKMYVLVVRPGVDLAFAGTIHKAQGSTRNKVIFCMVGATPKDFHCIYVGFSRVRHNDNIRVVLDKSRLGALSFLDDLRVPGP